MAGERFTGDRPHFDDDPFALLSELGSTPPLTEDYNLEGDSIAAYPEGVSVMKASAVADWDGTASDCVVITYQAGNEGWQVLSVGDGGLYQQSRFWDSVNVEWGGWFTYANSLHTHSSLTSLQPDAFAESAGINSFAAFSVMPVTSGANWGPNTGQAGHVITERNGSDGKQTFHQYSNATSYTRTYTGSAWTSWSGPTLAEDTNSETDPITDYPLGITIMPVSAAADWDGRGMDGTVVTERTANGGGQRFTTEDGVPIFRLWTGLAWSPWDIQLGETQADGLYVSSASISLGTDTFAEFDSITDYEDGYVSFMPVTAGANWGPNTGQAGHVITERNGSDGKQTFHQYSNRTDYTRTYTGGSWSDWATADMTNEEILTALNTAAGTVEVDITKFDRQNSAPTAPGSAGSKLYAFNQDGITVLEGRTEGGGIERFLRDQADVGYNNSGSTIPIGALVRVTGWDATRGEPTIGLASNDAVSTMYAAGMTIAAIPNNTSGRVWSIGNVSELNTNGMTVGGEIYLGTGGAFTQTAPTLPTRYLQILGEVVVAHASTGVVRLAVSPQYTKAATVVPVVLFDGGATLATSVIGDVGAWLVTSSMAGTLIEVRARLRTASTSGSVTAVVTHHTSAGTTTTVGTLTIAANANPPVSNTLTPTQAMAAGDFLTVHVTGAGTGAKMLTVAGEIAVPTV